ncbi:hypothetical protein AYO45_00295 [Gammaproteobacteria bacterium SCGC AG-212-F23]|nr:hypothetical protein AYO45_00295 [Gammaproteobacteria bacterium SCGC AG-212-F23]
MRVKYLESIEYQAIGRLKAIQGNVVLRKDFNDLGSYRQISRVLKGLIAEKKLVKIGAGIYAKAYLSNTPTSLLSKTALTPPSEKH